jgi:hypothetical protein
MKALYSPKGEFTSELLEPKEGWTYSHLFDALGAFPKWRSAKLVAPFTPIVIYVNGTKNRVPETPKIELKYANGLMKIKFDGKSFTVKIR